MGKLVKNNRGFGVIEPLLGLVIVGLVVFVGWYAYHTKQAADTTYDTITTNNKTPVKPAPKTTSPNPGTDVTNPTASTTVTDADKGKTVTIKNGQDLYVQLASTYWTFNAVSSDVLHTVGDPVKVSKYNGVPGSGSGTTTAHFIANKAGTATVSASRVSCGEALACGAEAAHYSVTIVVQ